MTNREDNLTRRLNLLLQTGYLLMESLADTSRIMRNMKRTAAFLCLDEEKLSIYAEYNMLMINYNDDQQSFTKFHRCGHHSVNMWVISAISHLSWRALRQNYSLNEYSRQLNLIANHPQIYSPWLVAIGSGFACGGFCIQFGCDWPSFFYASIAAILASRFRMFLGKKNCNEYVGIGIAAFLATLMAWIFSFISTIPAIVEVVPRWMVSITPWHPLLACSLFIVPGVPLINFVSDMLNGYIQIGITRAVKILMMVSAMAFGIALAIKVCGIDNFVRNLSMTPHHSYWEFAIAAAISAVGFSMIFNIPRRLLGVVALGGIIAVCTRNLVNLGPSNGNIGLDLGLVAGSFVGSAIVSLITTQAIHWFNAPHHCLSIPSVIPMIPGVLMYRALFALIDMHGVVGEVTIAMHNGIVASLTILCIAIGVAIPNIFFRQMISPKHEQRLLHLLAERRRQQRYDRLNQAEIKARKDILNSGKTIATI